jgi:predicted patatin/cPLA2 family phospholipase
MISSAPGPVRSGAGSLWSRAISEAFDQPSRPRRPASSFEDDDDRGFVARRGDVTTGQLAAGTVRPKLATVLGERLATGSRPGRRTDGARVALAIEGGGMRGAVSAGMSLALQELGLLDAFDAVYGASAGAITSAWLLSSRPEGLRGFSDPRFAKVLIRKRNLLRGRPMVDVERLVEQVYLHEFPLDYASVLSTPIELHPLATDIATGQVADLHAELADTHSLRLAIRASAALPVLAGRPITLGGRRYFDAGLAESVPFRQALRDGATHVLVLRSRPALVGERAARVTPSFGARFVASVALRRHPQALRATYLRRAARQVEDDRLLAEYDADFAPLGECVVGAIWPDPSLPSIGRLETDGALLEEAFETGRSAVYAAWDGAASTLAAASNVEPAAGAHAAGNGTLAAGLAAATNEVLSAGGAEAVLSA